jgi:hypothetical protein
LDDQKLDWLKKDIERLELKIDLNQVVLLEKLDPVIKKHWENIGMYTVISAVTGVIASILYAYISRG